MSRTLLKRIVDALAGATGRAASFDRDDRRNLPGWPRGIDLEEIRARQVLSSITEPAQKALPLYWRATERPPMRVESATPFVVIDGGRSVGERRADL